MATLQGYPLPQLQRFCFCPVLETVLPVYATLVPVILVVGLGALLRQTGTLEAGADASLMRLVLRVFYPCLIFGSVVDNATLRQPETLAWAPALGFLTVVAGFGAGWVVMRRLHLSTRPERRTFALTTGVYNYGYFPIPIILALLDREILGVLFVFNVGVEIAMWSVGVLMLAGTQGKGFIRGALPKVLNPNAVAILIAVPVNLLGWGPRIPEPVTDTLAFLGACAIPIGLLLVGTTLRDCAGEVSWWREIRIPAGACLLRLGILPLLFFALAILLPLPEPVAIVVAIQAAMPSGVFPIVLARHFNGDPAVALRVVLGTTLAAILTMPLWLAFGAALFGW
ncbi:MAG: AEC family transporter [Opitutales bacterium]